MREHLDELLNEIGKRIGLDGLSLDDNNTLLLGLENDLFMSAVWRDDTSTLLLNSVVGVSPCTDQQSLYALMQTNCVFTEGQGMSFSLDPATDLVNLSQVVSIADRDSFKLQDKLDQFISAAAAWRARFESGEALNIDWSHPTGTQTPEIPSESFGLRL